MADTIDIEMVMHLLSEGTTEAEHRLKGYRWLLKIAESDGDKLDMRIFMDIRLFCSYVQRDIAASLTTLSSVALKVLGYLLQRKSFVTRLPDDEASKFLLNLVSLITTISDKTICGLGLWCLAVQEVKTLLVALHLERILSAVLHGIGNPLGSMSITYEALQAAKQLAKQLPNEMRDLSWTWAPPVYRNLVSSNAKVVELAESCLSETKSVLLPPLPRLSEVVMADIQHKLLPRMEDLIRIEGRSQCTAVHAWGWFVKLLGVKLAEKKSLLNAMLKLMEICFVSSSAQVRSASQVAWVPLIDLFVPYPSEAAANESRADPSTVVSLSPKRLNLLLMPLRKTMSWEQEDIMVQRNCCCTWIHLLCKLGRSVNEQPVFDAAVLPMLELVFKMDKKLRDESVWMTCVELVTDAVSLKRLRETRLDPETRKPTGTGESPKAPAGITYTGVFSESHHKNICWSPWHLDRVDSYLKIVRVLWSSGLQQLDLEKYEDRHLTAPNGNFEVTQECWRLLVRAVEAEGRNAIRPSTEHVTAVHLLLKFLSDICSEVQLANLFLPAWALIEILIDGLGHNVVASSFYKIRLQDTYMSSMLETRRDSSPKADSLVLNTVIPVVYISAAWFKLVFETTSGGQGEEMWFQPIEKLINAGRTGFDIMGNYLGVASILDHLAKEGHRHLEENPGSRKASPGISNGQLAVNRNWHFLLVVWRILAEKLKESAELSNDIPPVGSRQRDSGYHVVLDVLLFPIRNYFLLSPVGDPSLRGELCENSAWRHESTPTLTAETGQRHIEGGWFKLFDSVLRISSLKSPQPNSFISAFFHRLLKAMRSSLQEEGAELLPGGMETWKIDYCKVSDSFLRFLGDIVVHAMKHADISSPAMLAISRKRRKTGHGTSSVRVQCVAGMELEDANNLKNLLNVASRSLTLSFKKFNHDESEHSMHEPIIRVLSSLTTLMQHVTSQNDSILLLQALAEPFASWFGVNAQDSACRTDGASQGRQLPVSLVEGLAQAWDGLLFCLQTCRPCLVFDSKLLLAQASSLAPAFLHPCDAISNRTLTFWEGTYGSKAAHLNYPPGLVKVFGSLKHKVQISLPGWKTKTSALQETHVHNVPQSFFRQPFSRVRQFQGRIQSMRDAVEKRGVIIEDHQSHSKGSEESKLDPTELAGGPELEQELDEATGTDRSSGKETCSGDTKEPDQSGHDAGGKALEEVSEFMPTPEGNTLIDALFNMDSVMDGLLSTGRYISKGHNEAPTEDSQAVEFPSELEITDFLQDCSIPEVQLESENIQLKTQRENAHDGDLLTASNAEKNVTETGTLVTPPIVLNDVPSVPPKILVGAERPQESLNAGLQATVSAESKGGQAVSNLPRRRKKLKFQDDSQEVEYVVIPHSQRKKAGPLTERQREVRLSQRTNGPGVKTYTRADFSQSGNGCDDDLMESQALEGPLETPCQEIIPLSNSVSFQPCASRHRAARRPNVGKVARCLEGNDVNISDESIKTIPLDQVDYVQLKIRLTELMRSDTPLTYRQIFEQEGYECLPKLIQHRLISQYCHLRRKLAESINGKSAEQPPATTVEQPRRGLKKSPLGWNANPGERRDLARIDHGEQIPSSCLLKRRPGLQGNPKRSLQRAAAKNLRSSGKLRGGKNWRINSESGKVITARLGIKKIVAKKRQKRRNVRPKAEKLLAADVNEEIIYGGLPDFSTNSCDRTMQAYRMLNLEKSPLQQPDQTLLDLSCRSEENFPSTSTDCMEKADELQGFQPMTEWDLTSELQVTSPFKVRTLNQGLLASSFNSSTKTGDEISSQEFNQGCSSTLVNTHNPQDGGPTERFLSRGNSLDDNQGQFKERSVSEEEDPRYGLVYPSKPWQPKYLPPSPWRLENTLRGECGEYSLHSLPSIEDAESIEIYVDLVCEESSCRMSYAYGEDEDVNTPAFLRNPPAELSLKTGLSTEESTGVDQPDCAGDLKTLGDTCQGLVEPDGDRTIPPERSIPGEVHSDSRNQEILSLTVYRGKERARDLQLLLERQEVHVGDVISAILASSKLKRMAMSELTEVYELASKLKEAVAVAGQSHS